MFFFIHIYHYSSFPFVFPIILVLHVLVWVFLSSIASVPFLSLNF